MHEHYILSQVCKIYPGLSELHWGSNSQQFLSVRVGFCPFNAAPSSAVENRKNGKFVSGHTEKLIYHRTGHNFQQISVGTFVNISQIRSEQVQNDP